MAFSRIGRGKTIAVVDIGSGHVGCAIISQNGTHGRVLSSARSKLVLEPRDEAHAQARLAEEIQEAITAATARTPGTHISDVFITIHSPWAISRVVAATAASQNETVIRAAHLSKLADNALLSAPDLDRAALFESSAISVRLNGYPTQDPEGKHAREVELYAIASIADTGLRSGIEHAVHAGFPSSRLVWRSAARVYSQMFERMTVPRDAIVVDFGVLASSLMLIKDGLLSGEQHTGEGLQSMLERVHGARPPEELLSLLRMLERDACADDACAELQSALTTQEPELVKAFGESFATLAEAKRLPPEMLVVAHPDMGPWLKHFFERIDFTQFTITAQPFIVRILTGADCAQWLGSEHGLDASLSLLASHAVSDVQSTF